MDMTRLQSTSTFRASSAPVHMPQTALSPRIQEHHPFTRSVAVTLRKSSRFACTWWHAQSRNLSKAYGYSAPRSSAELFTPGSDISHSRQPDSFPASGVLVEDEAKFNWLAQWYPVGVVKHLDKRQPHAVTVLGRDVVVWWDRLGEQWQVYADSCPHRLAPLSEGRINENGHLQCSYHGWTFEPTSGQCTLIPHAPKEQMQKFQQSKRACVQVYHSIVHHGLVWAYLDTTEGAKMRANSNLPPYVPMLEDPSFVYDMGVSDVPYTYETLVENLLDPGHVNFAHHKLQGNRNAAKPIFMEVKKVDKDGITGEVQFSGDDRFVFIAPVHITMEFSLPPPKEPQGSVLAMKFWTWIKSIGGRNRTCRRVATVFFCVPSIPGRSKLYFSFPRNFATWLFHVIPRWLDHQRHMTVLDSDSYLLHIMERRVEDIGGTDSWDKHCYTPTTADRYVVAFRKWLKNFAGGSPDYGTKYSNKLPTTPPKRQLLNRYEAHVSNCTVCSGALHNLQRIEASLQVLAIALVGIVAASAVKSFQALKTISIPVVCLAVLCAIGSRALSKYIEKQFFFHDYNHALID